jgi:hypothetical protein
MCLSERTDPVLMSEIRRRALFSLIEMCHWTWDGHSLPACRILERALELPETTPPYSEEDTHKLTEAALPLRFCAARASRLEARRDYAARSRTRHSPSYTRRSRRSVSIPLASP